MKYGRSMPIGVRATKRRKNNGKRFFSTLLVLVLAVAAGYLLYVNGTFDKIKESIFTLSQDTQDKQDTSKQNTNNDTQSTSGTNGDTTSDSSTTAKPGESTVGDDTDKENSTNTAPVKPVKDTSPIRIELENYIKGFKGQYGIHYINLVDGTEFGINDTDEYVAASTIKIPVNLYLFRKIQDGSIDPESVVTYTSKDYEGGTGSIQYKKIGSKFTVRELSKLSIEQSDNVAINMIIRLIGGKAVYKEFLKQVGGTTLDPKRNITSPKDMALYAKLVYEFSNEDKELGGELIGYMENTIFNDRIPKLLPPDVKVAHKIGNQVGALHDVGIVFADEPYVISIMSKNVDETQAYDVIANISKKVYDFVTEEK